MSIDFNVDEYVSEMLACSDERLSARDLAVGIADIAMSQGYCAGQEFEDVVRELEPQVSYYL